VYDFVPNTIDVQIGRYEISGVIMPNVIKDDSVITHALCVNITAIPISIIDIVLKEGCTEWRQLALVTILIILVVIHVLIIHI
jgi:hypothetical protein